MNIMQKTITAAYHPLDPLSAAEIGAAAEIVRQADYFNAFTKFETIELHYPDKALVQAWQPGQARLPRRAFVCVYDTDVGTVRECRVDLDHNEILDMKIIPGAKTAIVIDEIAVCAENVAKDADFIAAMARRGISDLSTIQVDRFSAGNFDFENEKEARVVHCWVYLRSDPFDNGYAHPVEGLNVIYDLNKEQVLQVLDRTIADIPTTDRNYGLRYEEIAARTRQDLKPIAISQPDGPSFSVHGNQISWLNWHFHVEFNAREGLILNDIRFQDKERLRPILHRASVAEMVVPYGDPSYGHYRKNAFDVGEYGIGRLANSLSLGCDCRGHIHYFDGLVCDTAGNPRTIENAICLHEEDDGMLWKHTDLMTMSVETRRSRRLVISSIATVGNYEYGFFWNFYLDGTLELEVKLTGIMNTAGINDISGTRYGEEVSKGVIAQNHLHIFCARLDTAIDGNENSLVEVNVTADPPGPDNPFGNGFQATDTLLASEKMARRNRNEDTERYWKIINPNQHNALGKATAYKLHAPSMVRTFFQPEAKMNRRAAFTQHHVWATAYDPAQFYPAGNYVNQSDGADGLLTWTDEDRPIENTDIVLWHTFGILHIPRIEDFPVQPVVKCGFSLMANGFFDENPTLDMPSSTDGGDA